jgi:hypothetical protein
MTPERKCRHELLHQCGYISIDTPLGVLYKLWIKVPRIVSQWSFTHCMCEQKFNTASQNPRKKVKT